MVNTDYEMNTSVRSEGQRITDLGDCLNGMILEISGEIECGR